MSGPGRKAREKKKGRKRKEKKEKNGKVEGWAKETPDRSGVAKRKKKRMKQKRKRQSKGFGGGKGDGGKITSTKSNWEQLQETLGGKGRSDGKKKVSLMPDSVRRSKKRKRGADGYAAAADTGSSSADAAGGGEAVGSTAAGVVDPSLYIACDAEMVGVGAADTSALARVSLTDWYGRVLYDKFVKPRGRVTNYRTWVSGIRKRDLQHAMPFARAKADVAALLKGKILVGHAVHNDLKCLETKHPDEFVRDTAQYPPLMRRNPATGKLQPRKLKDLSEQIGYAIQSGSHSSVEDAQATMRVYRHYKKEWDKWLDSGGKYVPPAVPDVKTGDTGGFSRGKMQRPSVDPFASKHTKRRRQETNRDA